MESFLLSKNGSSYRPTSAKKFSKRDRDAKYYEAHAQIINLGKITSNEKNAKILRRLRDNDPNFTTFGVRYGEYTTGNNTFAISPGDDLGWLGYFLSINTTLQYLSIDSLPTEAIANRLGDFFEGLSRNRSIQTLRIGADLGRGFRKMSDFFRNNNNLRELCFGGMDDIRIESARSIAFMLSQYKQSRLLELSFEENNLSDEAVAEIVTAISTHSQLQVLNLGDNNLSRQGSVALGNALKACNNPQLKELYLE